MATITLNSGFQMPVIGLGVWRMEKSSIETSFSIPSRLAITISTVLQITRARQKLEKLFQKHLGLGLCRGRSFLSQQRPLWNSDHGHVLEACKDSLRKLQLDYLDLYLVHFPIASKHTGVGTNGSAFDKDGMLDIDTTISLETTWHAMEDLASLGLVRSIGISNYDIFLTRDCLAYSKVKPAVNQVESHPYFQRDSLLKFCQKQGICVTAHNPLGGALANTLRFGSVSCLDDPVLLELAKKYKKSLVQIALRWGIQRKMVVIPKTLKAERLEENFRVWDFELSEEDMDNIQSMDKKYRANLPVKAWGIDPYA
ncbi:hypothetical protein SLA2020_054580 [Shorea laevis]